MDNPLHLPRPNDQIQQIHDYARDFAYLYLQNPWIELHRVHQLFELDFHQIEFIRKWGGSLASLSDEDWAQIESAGIMKRATFDPDSLQPIVSVDRDILESFGYLRSRVTSSGDTMFVPTQKAFELLDKPLKPPSIFISYRRSESSAFALLIESRLRLVGVTEVFIDRDIPGGSDWERHIRERIGNAQTFIVLVGAGTLTNANGWVEKELDWAVEAKCQRIIPIWHNQHTIEKQQNSGHLPAVLSSSQGYTLKAETALEYETAVNWLLNTLGYRTY